MKSFKARSLCIINDFSIEERKYLFKKTKELKEAIRDENNEKINEFKINSKDFGIYEIFLESSTRTQQSFRNACDFLNTKLMSLPAESSSFNKSESYLDTFNNLIGYKNNIFIIRSNLEGVCRWLEEGTKEYVKRQEEKLLTPAFINAGDGQHEHPTQELLDEFTFLEDNNWSYETLHLALVGDLFHGRTVHSKADGLKIFKNVKIDLIAPKELKIPKKYIDIMKKNNFEVREFNSIEEYLSQKDIASKWYFTRPQLERMGEDVLKKQDILREAITFKREYLKLIKGNFKFYHPLPRHKVHPVIPTFLDSTRLNGWEKQSANGMLVRIVLLSLIAGKIGSEFREREKREKTQENDFIEQIKIAESERQNKVFSQGVIPIQNGIVIDHISKGLEIDEIRANIQLILKNIKMEAYGGEWVSKSKKNGKNKGIIFRTNFTPDEVFIKKLAASSPGVTLNIIENSEVKFKYNLKTPPLIYGFEEATCKNVKCISNKSNGENIQGKFKRIADETFICVYCEREYKYKEIWE